MIELKPHQLKASKEIVDCLEKYNFCMLSGEPRTGKTLTVIDVYKYLGVRGKAGSMLFVTKKNAMESIKKDFASNLSDIYHYEIINFESAHKAKLKAYDILIIDEVHAIGYIQKPKQINKKLSKIKHKYYIGMSGTIHLETFSTTYSLYKIAFQQYSNFYSWAKVFVNIKDKYIGQIAVKDYTEVKNKDTLMSIINKYNVVMTQESAGFKTRVKDVVHIVNSKNINSLCKIIKEQKQYTFKSGKQFVADTLSRELQAIKQLQSGGLKISIDSDDYLLLDSFKVDYIVEKFNGKKIAIYYNYISERLMLEMYLPMAGLKITYSAEDFNQTDSNTVFVGQFVSKREGVNLSASNDIIFMSVPFSNLSYLQSRERCILRDKTEEINCHILCTNFDKIIYDIVKNEKSVFSFEIYKSMKNKNLFDI